MLAAWVTVALKMSSEQLWVWGEEGGETILMGGTPFWVPPGVDWGGRGLRVAKTALMGCPLTAAWAAFLANSSFSSGLEGGVIPNPVRL